MGDAGPAGGVNKVLIVVMVCLGMFIGCSWCQNNGNAEAAVYVTEDPKWSWSDLDALV